MIKSSAIASCSVCGTKTWPIFAFHLSKRSFSSGVSFTSMVLLHAVPFFLLLGVSRERARKPLSFLSCVRGVNDRPMLPGRKDNCCRSGDRHFPALILSPTFDVDATFLFVNVLPRTFPLHHVVSPTRLNSTQLCP